MRALRRLLPLLVVAVSLNCAALAPIRANSCGNAVIEPGEDCDSFPLGEGTLCRPPDRIGACRLDCTASTNGASARCPGGWGCGYDGICRQPLGKYGVEPETVTASAFRLRAVDFAGLSGKAVMSLGEPELTGSFRFRVHTFDMRGLPLKSETFPQVVQAVHVADINGDGRDDLITITGDLSHGMSIATMLGQRDGTMVALGYPASRMTGHVYELRLDENDEAAFFVNSASGGALLARVNGQSLGNAASSEFRTLATLPKGPDDLAGDVTLGDLIDEPSGRPPMREAVFTFRGAAEVQVVQLLDANRNSQNSHPTGAGATPVIVRLPAGETARQAALVGDANGDGHADLLVTVDGAHDEALRVAFSDGSGRFYPTVEALANSRLQPHRPSDAVAGSFAAFDTNTPYYERLLATGDLDGDPFVDFVSDQGIHITVGATVRANGLPSWSTVAINDDVTSPWTGAIIGHFGVNAEPSVATMVAGKHDLAFFNGGPGGQFRPFRVTTEGPVAALAATDLDGDMLDDLLLVERPEGASGKNHLTCAYGQAAGPPLAPVTLARFEPLSQVVPTANWNRSLKLAPKREGLDLVAWSEDGRATFLYTLPSSGDRLPFATFRPLSSPEPPLSAVRSAGSFGVVALARGGAGPTTDALVLQTIAPIGDPTSITSTPIGRLPERLRSLADATSGSNFGRTSVHIEDADLDGDGVEEHVLLGPCAGDASASGSALWVLRGVAAGALTYDEPILLDETVDHTGKLALADLDGDGAVDVVALTGAPSAHRLRVFWNDRAGHFSMAASTSLGVGDAPLDFTAVASGRPGRSVAYVNDAGVSLVDLHGRVVAKPESIGPLAGGRAIVAADVDGDGVEDLVVAANGELHLLRGKAVLP